MKRRINWKHVALFIILLLCAGIMISDLLSLIIVPIITGHGIGFTMYGLITFIVAYTTATLIIQDIMG